MPTGTLAPPERRQYFDNSGKPLAYGRLYTYAAGTDTPLAVFTDITLTVPHPNPAVLDAAGRITLYILPASYKFTLKDQNDLTIWTQDNIPAVPATAADLDLDGMAGASLTAPTPVYLNTDGRWYPSRGDQPTSSSSAAIIGMTVVPIAAGTRGTIRLSGRVTGFQGLTPGAAYYVAATGGITSVVSAGARLLGCDAPDAQSLILQPKAPPATAGFHDLFLPALAFQPRTALSPCGAHEHLTTGAAADLIGLPFPLNTAAFAVIRAPKSWDRSWIWWEPLWTQKAGGTGNCAWSVYIDCFGKGSGLPQSSAGNTTHNPVGATLVIQESPFLVSATPPSGVSVATNQHLLVTVARAAAASSEYANPIYFLGVSLHLKTTKDTDD